MRNPDDIEMARLRVAVQLARRDIGASHQRAFLQGLLTALEWVLGKGGTALQRLADGHEMKVDDGARIAGPPNYLSRKPWEANKAKSGG